MKKWLVTWDRKEYKEWAKPTRGGYLLIVLRKEKDRYLCVKAKLKMGAKGLPGFVVLKEIYFSSRKEAEKQIYAWMKS